MLWPLLTLSLAFAVEVERVLALVNGIPILATDAELAEVAQLVPREAEEDEAAYRRVVVEALIALELRWQDLEAAAIPQRTDVDLERAWQGVETRAGGEAQLAAQLASLGLSARTLRDLVRRAAIVQAYVTARFAPFARPTPREVEDAWEAELAPALLAAGEPVPELDEVLPQVEALVRERKLNAEIERWTMELANRSEVVRYHSR